MKTRRFLFTAGIVLAMAFMLSCFPDGGEGGSNISTCGGKEYDTTVYFCERGELAGSCRGQTYYPDVGDCGGWWSFIRFSKNFSHFQQIFAKATKIFSSNSAWEKPQTLNKG